MRKFLVSAAILGATSALAQSAEVLVAGRVDKIALLPSGSNACPALCPQMATPLPNGGTHVCLSNDCGCQVTDIKVDKVLLGNDPGAVLQVTSRLGEWCKPTFPVSSSPLLVHMRDGTAHWSLLETQQAARRFDAKPFDTIGKVRVDSLPQDGGKVRLDELIERLAK